jgi:hypothetical protein
MALRLSTALRNAILSGSSFQKAMSNCVLKIYTGTQPATPETAPSGTLLCTYSNASGALTREVQSIGSVDLTGGGAGSVDTITVNSIEIMGSATAFNTSLAQTAADVVTKINRNPFNHLFDAYVSATDVINIRARPGLGALANGWVVASTVTTITKTDNNMASGVSAVNGLNWNVAATNVITKRSDQTWSGSPGNTGTAGWFRFEAAVSDAGGADSSEAILRMDGSIASSGAEMNRGNLTITTAVTDTIDSFSITFPTA